MEQKEEAAPPEAREGLWRMRMRAQSPITSFLKMEASGGIILLVVTILAMVWANVFQTYERTWTTMISLHVGSWNGACTVRFLINEGLMTLFFCVAGMEIKRAVVEGDLGTVKGGLLPFAGAVGGMVFPAILYTVINHGGSGMRGAAVPTATDIAFALGVMMLCGKLVPKKLRTFLLSLAVIDDLGAMIVIALFYSGGVHVAPLLVGGCIVAFLICMVRLFGLRSGWWYAIPGIVAWTAFHHAGLHPTLAGVVIGLSIPSKSWMTPRPVFLAAVRLARGLVSKKRSANADEDDAEEGDHGVAVAANSIRELLDVKLLSPLTRMEGNLHGFVVYLILPLFALANAGVSLRGMDLSGGGVSVASGIVVGFVVGKPIGIVALVWVVVRLGLASLPPVLNMRKILFAGILGGIGLTMATFTAGLAFSRPEQAGLLAAAKFGIVCGSSFAALLAYGMRNPLLSKRS